MFSFACRFLILTPILTIAQADPPRPRVYAVISTEKGAVARRIKRDICENLLNPVAERKDSWDKLTLLRKRGYPIWSERLRRREFRSPDAPLPVDLTSFFEGNKRFCDLDVVKRHQQDREGWLRMKLNLQVSNDGERLYVRFLDGSLQDQIIIINTLLDYYMEKRITPGRRGLERQIAELKERSEKNNDGKQQSYKRAIQQTEEILQITPRIVERAKVR